MTDVEVKKATILLADYRNKQTKCDDCLFTLQKGNVRGCLLRALSDCEHKSDIPDDANTHPINHLMDKCCRSNPNCVDCLIEKALGVCRFGETRKPINKSNESDNDPITHPVHYTDGNIEVWDFIADKKLSFFSGNVIKYVCRAGKKDPDKRIEDLKKARAYIDKQIELWESESECQGIDCAL